MKNPQAIIFFDGVCNLCNASVQYVIKRDKKHVFYFAALQSAFASRFFDEHNFKRQSDSIVLFFHGNFFTESSAALRIAKQLAFPSNIWYIFTIIPKAIRDFFYRYIAAKRYSWFGKQESCMIPTEDVAHKFLDT